jgi:hypothetical protein
MGKVAIELRSPCSISSSVASSNRRDRNTTRGEARPRRAPASLVFSRSVKWLTKTSARADVGKLARLRETVRRGRRLRPREVRETFIRKVLSHPCSEWRPEANSRGRLEDHFLIMNIRRR